MPTRSDTHPGAAQRLQTQHHGLVAPGFQFASGRAVGRADNPFPESTLRMQALVLKAKFDLDLEAEVPGLVWGTVNVALAYDLRRLRPDVTVEGVDWTEGLEGAGRIAPETFSFTRCCLVHADRCYPGLIYMPHPETKPAINSHRHNVLEVLTSQVDGLVYQDPVTVVCRADAFQIRTEES